MTNVTASSNLSRDSEDALKVLGRIADAFDNPGSLHKMDKEVLFVVNVVKSRHLLSSLSSEESVCQDTTCGWYDSSLDTSYDEDVEVVELGDVSKWEHASSYPYASRRHQSSRSFSERIFRQDDGMYDVTKMLLTSSPLDRLDRLARMELKKTGWFERRDKWSVVQLGLPGVPLPASPPKTPPDMGKGRKESSSTRTSPGGEKHAPRSSRRPRREHGRATPKSSQQRGDAIKSITPGSMESPVRSQDTDLADFSTLSYADASRLSSKDTTTPIRVSRLSRTLLHPNTSPQQTRRRLGQAVRNFVKKMLPPSSGSGSCSARYPRTRQTGDGKCACEGSPAPSGRAWQMEMTPQSDISEESRWTFASAGSWVDGPAQGCLDYQATNRWSGFWH